MRYKLEAFVCNVLEDKDRQFQHLKDVADVEVWLNEFKKVDYASDGYGKLDAEREKWKAETVMFEQIWSEMKVAEEEHTNTFKSMIEGRNQEITLDMNALGAEF